MYVAIGPAQCRHRSAGGQPFRDVAARTAGAEHPTTVFVGCGACNKAPHSASTPAECLKHAFASDPVLGFGLGVVVANLFVNP